MLDDPYPKVQPGPPRPSQAYRPLQFSMPQGTERYVVEGNSAVLIPVEANDQIHADQHRRRAALRNRSDWCWRFDRRVRDRDDG